MGKVKTKGLPVGRWPATGYTFQYSPALGSDGYFSGLVLDEINHRRLSSERIYQWAGGLRVDFGWP